jgi:hypothetical protein
LNGAVCAQSDAVRGGGGSSAARRRCRNILGDDASDGALHATPCTPGALSFCFVDLMTGSSKLRRCISLALP